MANSSESKIKKIEETLLRYKKVEKGEYKYFELCRLLGEKEIPHGTQKRKTQLKHWKQYMDIEYLPKNDTWLVKEIYEEKLLEKISSSQYYERMCCVLFIYLYQKYEVNKNANPNNNISVQLTLTGNELYKLFGLVNDRWGILYNNYEPTKLKEEIVDRYPNTYSEFVGMVAIFSKTILDNCLKSLREKRLINYYVKYQICTRNKKIITLNEEQTNLLTKVERKILDEMYDEIYGWNIGDKKWKERSQFGIQDICARNKLEDFRKRVCTRWKFEDKDKGGGLDIKWYRCVYTINAIKGYFERYINDVVKNDLEYAEWCLEKYKKELNDLSIKKLMGQKKDKAVEKFKENIPLVEKAKDGGEIFIPSKSIKIYNEMLTYYHLVKFGELIDNTENEKFPDPNTAVKTYKEVYNKMLSEIVKRY